MKYGHCKGSISIQTGARPWSLSWQIAHVVFWHVLFNALYCRVNGITALTTAWGCKEIMEQDLLKWAIHRHCCLTGHYMGHPWHPTAPLTLFKDFYLTYYIRVSTQEFHAMPAKWIHYHALSQYMPVQGHGANFPLQKLLDFQYIQFAWHYHNPNIII